ncbi:chemotaxis-specific protein-glutamate methyltransferase CheB [Roseateles amylovorans]|uniref:Protein-glutamate methylesterase/protein-glutamine glutaminase n=1 Tax=Roseateles amylovorans TaxID=2978473 RepID=A0ABY6AUS6_9BURK|nr:chemotaxis-specific protein-glutamate methyltransferase CheB [Roseateles amylovorans]UXH76767.1 chemotaxis-specific protein-glutamate methyltransferase CheB [Roseateles amylovorans]
MIKILVVDDSALMRRQLTLLFQAEGDFEVRQARNGIEAVAENLAFEPDVVTLDINMPDMDGITALSLIMADRPVPVVMVSSLTEKGALATFEALNLGAIDYIAKPGGTISLSLEQVKAELIDKVRSAARARLRPRLRRRSDAVRPAAAPAASAASASSASSASSGATASRAPRSEGLLLIGVSTGGPRALEEVLPLLPADYPWPVVVAQHMPASFTAPFAARMNGLCALEVLEASRPMPLEAGKVYIGKGGADVVFARRGGVLHVMPRPENAEMLWHPSVELMGRSALEHLPADRINAVMLTGMGYDGADAFTAIKRGGGRTIAESSDTAVVFGMPAELIARGGAGLILPLEKIASQLKLWATR